MDGGLSVVIPIYNEQDNLSAMVGELSAHLDRSVGAGLWRLVLVDNGSTDDTARIAQQIAARYPLSQYIRLPRPDYGGALQAGLLAAKTRWAHTASVDFWDPVFLSWCWWSRGRYDLVLGSKRAESHLNNLAPYRRFLSLGLNTVFKILFNFSGTDTRGIKFLDLEALWPIISGCRLRRGFFDTEYALKSLRQGLRVVEVPVPIKVIRKQRNLMLAKILKNIGDIPALAFAVHTWPRKAGPGLGRLSRARMLEDLKAGSAGQS